MKRIALLFPGCVAKDDSPMRIPAHVHLVKTLSRDFDVVVFSVVKPDKDKDPFMCGNASVIYVNAFYNDSFLNKFRGFYTSFKKEHHRKPFTIVHGFWAYYCGFIAVILGKLFHLPSFVTLQGGETANLPLIRYGNMTRSLLKKVTAFTCRSANILIALTKFQVDALPQLDIHRNDIHIIPFGAEKMFYENKEKKGLSTPIRFLHVAGINHVKDQTTLLRTFQIIRKTCDCELHFVGEDHLDGKMQQLTKELQLNELVQFLGPIRHDELPQQYAWADILLHTSLHEAQAVVVAEAAAAGLLLCGTKVGLLSDLTPYGAITAPPGDSSGLAEEVLQLLSNQHRQAELRKNALRWAITYDADWTAREYSKLYKRVLDTL